VPGALYGVLMYAGGLLFAWLMRRQAAGAVGNPAAGTPR